MKKYIYIISYYILYLFCSIYYYNWNMNIKRVYGNLIMPMIFYTVCSIVLGAVFFLFLQECWKCKKRQSKLLLTTTIVLFVLTILPYLLYIPNLPVIVYTMIRYSQKLIDFSPIAGFSFAICLMMYLWNVRYKEKEEQVASITEGS